VSTIPHLPSELAQRLEFVGRTVAEGDEDATVAGAIDLGSTAWLPRRRERRGALPVAPVPQRVDELSSGKGRERRIRRRQRSCGAGVWPGHASPFGGEIRESGARQQDPSSVLGESVGRYRNRRCRSHP